MVARYRQLVASLGCLNACDCLSSSGAAFTRNKGKVVQWLPELPHETVVQLPKHFHLEPLHCNWSTAWG